MVLLVVVVVTAVLILTQSGQLAMDCPEFLLIVAQHPVELLTTHPSFLDNAVDVGQDVLLNRADLAPDHFKGFLVLVQFLPH